MRGSTYRDKVYSAVKEYKSNESTSTSQQPISHLNSLFKKLGTGVNSPESDSSPSKYAQRSPSYHDSHVVLSESEEESEGSED